MINGKTRQDACIPQDKKDTCMPHHKQDADSETIQATSTADKPLDDDGQACRKWYNSSGNQDACFEWFWQKSVNDAMLMQQNKDDKHLYSWPSFWPRKRSACAMQQEEQQTRRHLFSKGIMRRNSVSELYIFYTSMAMLLPPFVLLIKLSSDIFNYNRLICWHRNCGNFQLPSDTAQTEPCLQVTRLKESDQLDADHAENCIECFKKWWNRI